MVVRVTRYPIDVVVDHNSVSDDLSSKFGQIGEIMKEVSRKVQQQSILPVKMSPQHLDPSVSNLSMTEMNRIFAVGRD